MKKTAIEVIVGAIGIVMIIAFFVFMELLPLLAFIVLCGVTIYILMKGRSEKGRKEPKALGLED